MIPWVLLDTAVIPDGGGELRLLQRGGEFAIRAGTRDLMNSRMSGSEIALASLACERLRGRRNCRFLIGGYGMGFTLRAALAGLARDAEVVVSELVPAVVAWARGPMADLSAGCLDDRRVRIREGDVSNEIGAGRSRYDAILLDVDNGPHALSRSANDRLYSAKGLRMAHGALRPGGILAVWSAAPDREFAERLERGRFAVEEKKVRANSNGKGARHVIWLATRRDA